MKTPEVILIRQTWWESLVSMAFDPIDIILTAVILIGAIRFVSAIGVPL